MIMSGGTPVGGGYMRQRHNQGYASGGDDLEDDACSRTSTQSSSLPRTRRWIEMMENVIWIASAFFILYYGDGQSDFISLLWDDNRIWRLPLYLGILCVWLNVVLFFYTCMLTWGVRKPSEKWEISSVDALPLITALGLSSFCLFSFALWPIWSFLTLPLVFTLFMACMVILPHLVFGTFKPLAKVPRAD